jgi:hypothetical protein
MTSDTGDERHCDRHAGSLAHAHRHADIHMRRLSTRESDGPCGNEDVQTAEESTLCQVSDHVSCGACCGLYNVPFASRNALVRVLQARTRQFETTPRTVDAIFEFKRQVETREGKERPMPDFHHCPFLGLMGPEHTTVGCLLHPQASGNHGLDFRSVSYYGGMTCHIYFCPSTRLLPQRYKQIVRSVLDDWYLYGLIVTETKLLQAFFEELEDRINRPLYAEDFTTHRACREALKFLFLLRVSWPFRAPDNHRVANYFFNDHLYARPPLQSPSKGQSISRYRLILQELETDPTSNHALRQAELYLNDRFKLVQDALETA